MTHRSIIALATGLVWAATFSAALAQATAPTSAPATQPARQTHTVKKGALIFQWDTESAFQAVEPFEARLRPKAYAGPLVVLSAAPHAAPVKKDQVVLELDLTWIKRDLIGAESDLAAAKAAFRKAEDDLALGEQSEQLALKVQTADVQNATTALSWWEKLDGPRMLQDADLSVQRWRNNVEDQQDELDQLKKMYKSEELTLATADIVVKRALRNLEIGRKQLKTVEGLADKTRQTEYPIAKQKLDDALTAAQQKLAALKSSQAQARVLRQGALTGAKLALERAEKRMEDLKADLDSLTVRSTLDGVLLYGSAVPAERDRTGRWIVRKGERVDLTRADAGGSVLTVYAPGKLRLVLDVPEGKAMWLAAPGKATVSPTALPGVSYTGQAAPVRARFGAGQELAVELGDVDARLAPGMKAKVKVDAGKVDGVLIVPLAAVTGGKVTVRGQDGKTSERAVVTGRFDDKNIEIVQGLAVGDTVIVEAGK